MRLLDHVTSEAVPRLKRLWSGEYDPWVAYDGMETDLFEVLEHFEKLIRDMLDQDELLIKNGRLIDRLHRELSYGSGRPLEFTVDDRVREARREAGLRALFDTGKTEAADCAAQQAEDWIRAEAKRWEPQSNDR